MKTLVMLLIFSGTPGEPPDKTHIVPKAQCQRLASDFNSYFHPFPLPSPFSPKTNNTEPVKPYAVCLPAFPPVR